MAFCSDLGSFFQGRRSGRCASIMAAADSGCGAVVPKPVLAMVGLWTRLAKGGFVAGGAAVCAGVIIAGVATPLLPRESGNAALGLFAREP